MTLFLFWEKVSQKTNVFTVIENNFRQNKRFKSVFTLFNLFNIDNSFWIQNTTQYRMFLQNVFDII